MNKKIDVAVVGAGPCGSFTAYTAARLGVDVLVFEEHHEIGVPTHCAGHLSITGLKRLGLCLPQKIVENMIRGVVFYSPLGSRFSVRFNFPITIVVNRELFDKYIAKLAGEVGVQYCLGARVKSFLCSSGIVSGVVVDEHGKSRIVQSSIVVDAEGYPPVLLKKAGIQTPNLAMTVNAVQAEVDRIDDASEDMVEVYLGQEYAPGFFAWIIPKKDGTAKVGLATRTGNPKEYLQRFISKHPVASHKLRKSKVTHVSFHPISLGGPLSKTYADGVLAVGDAASQVKPTTGGGVILGLLCSKIAGEVVHEALKNNDFSAKFLSRYQRRWKQMIGFDMAVMLQTRKMLNRLSERQVDRLLKLCTELRVNEVLQGVRDVDLQGKSLMRLFLHPALHVLALQFFISWLRT